MMVKPNMVQQLKYARQNGAREGMRWFKKNAPSAAVAANRVRMGLLSRNDEGQYVRNLVAFDGLELTYHQEEEIAEAFLEGAEKFARDRWVAVNGRKAGVPRKGKGARKSVSVRGASAIVYDLLGALGRRS